MNITFYIDENGKVTITDFPIDLVDLVLELNPDFFLNIGEQEFCG
jgi:hypothetical protein